MFEHSPTQDDQTNEVEKRAREIAHEINNPLAIIKSKAYLLKKSHQEDGNSLDLISSMADRVSNLVKELEDCVRQARKS